MASPNAYGIIFDETAKELSGSFSDLIYHLNPYEGKQAALELVVVAFCLKHSILGGFSCVGASDVEKFMGGDGAGRVQR